MTWIIFWIIIYLIVILYFSLRHVKSQDIENYLVNSRKTRTIPLVFTTLATFVGGGTSIGLIAMGYESGFAAVGIGIAYVIGFFILHRFAGKINLIGSNERIYSFPEFLNKSYTGSNNTAYTRTFSSVVSGVNVFVFFFLLAAQFVGMAVLLKFSFSIGYETAAVISCLVVILYTTVAGLSGVIITDMIQFVVILFMIIFIFIPGIFDDTDGLHRLSELPENMLNGSFYGYLFLIGLPLFLAPSVMVRMDIWQRMFAAKNPGVARKTSLISGLGMLPFYVIFPLVGMAVRVVAGHDLKADDVTWLFLNRHCNDFIAGFAVIGLLSALMSSADSFLNVIAISTIRDFAGWKKSSVTVDKGKLQKLIRIATLAFGFLALFMALSFPKIVDLMVVGLATIVIFVPVTFLALFRKEVHRYRKTAMASVMSGFVVNLIFFILGIVNPQWFEPKSSFIPAFLAALVVLFTGLHFTKAKPSLMQ